MRHFTIPKDYTTNFNASNNGYVDATVNTEFYIVMPDNIIYKVGYDELPTMLTTLEGTTCISASLSESG